MPSSLPIASALIQWFQANQRPLPWRRHYTPYEVWISEIMLQQTQVKTALPYFERWMRAIPSIQALANASEAEILKLWEGLGYYSRALNLKKAALQILKEHVGIFPSEHPSILALPGIGPYTAGAIASIAFNQAYPIVDGNVVRVLSRLFAFEKDVRKNADFFWQKSAALLPTQNPRDFNQGLMELGALICTPKKPSCSSCPLQEQCMAFKKGLVESLPKKSPPKKKIPIQVAIGILIREGKVYVQKRPSKGLMSGLWEFPGGKIEKGESPEAALRREVQEETGLCLTKVRPFQRLQHSYTSYKVDLHCFIATAEEGPVQLESSTEYRWISPEELTTLAFPAANKKIIEKFLNAQPLKNSLDYLKIYKPPKGCGHCE